VSRFTSQRTRTALILFVSMLAVVLVTWFVPSINAASLNMLFRLRGTLPPPDDIIIVAIDDPSLQRIGNWPWPRSVMAEVIDKLSGAKPRAVGLDVIYAEPSNPANDQRLAEAIKRNGRVILPAQLPDLEPEADEHQTAASWLLPLPEIGAAAASIGHAHAAPDVDGILRSIQLSKADNRANRLWAFGLEVVRVAEQIPAGGFEEQPGALRFGPYHISVLDADSGPEIPGVTIVRSNEMLINYIGPTRSFRYYSIADVQSGNVPPATFANKIVLIGAVAQSMGDTRISPYMSYGGAERQSGQGMPGIEVHANVINTIRNHLWLKPVPEWLSFVLALAVILFVTLVIKWLDGWREVTGLSVILLTTIFGSFFLFNHFSIIPPLAPMLTGYLAAVPLLLLNQSLAASRDLDRKLETLASTQQGFLLDERQDAPFSEQMAFLGSILRAETAALFLKENMRGPLRLRDFYGARPPFDTLSSALKDDAQDHHADVTRVTVPLTKEDETLGALFIMRPAGEPFSESELRLIREASGGLSVVLSLSRQRAQLDDKGFGIDLPRNLAWKLRTVDDITAQLVARMSFMDRVFSDMTDAVLVGDITGQIVFANHRAAELHGSEPEKLVGTNFVNYFVGGNILTLSEMRGAMNRVLDGQGFQTEFELSAQEPRYYSLHLSAVTARTEAFALDASHLPASSSANPDGQRIIGLIAMIADITKRRELDRIRAETLQLVSHELRTPLTSIQGLSDVLLKFTVPAGESQDMLDTIHSEAVRLGEIINRYLDLTRLESGAQPLNIAPVSVEELIGSCVRSLSLPATEKQIEIKQTVSHALPPLLADSQLLTQAVTNLLSNAIKYSPAGSEIEIEAGCDDATFHLSVRDHGYGIPEEARDRIFEKFYRLERDDASEIIGTGLGLPLVKEIVERHGGRITVESQLNCGTTFTIYVPLRNALCTVVSTW
jgi:signal transduction histidine kinase/CHASE2 domain-containing sensor protein